MIVTKLIQKKFLLPSIRPLSTSITFKVNNKLGDADFSLTYFNGDGKQISPWRFGMHGGVGGRLGVASGAKFG